MDNGLARLNSSGEQLQGPGSPRERDLDCRNAASGLLLNDLNEVAGPHFQDGQSLPPLIEDGEGNTGKENQDQKRRTNDDHVLDAALAARVEVDARIEVRELGRDHRVATHTRISTPQR